MNGVTNKKENNKVTIERQKFSDDGTYTFFWLVICKYSYRWIFYQEGCTAVYVSIFISKQ